MRLLCLSHTMSTKSSLLVTTTKQLRQKRKRFLFIKGCANSVITNDMSRRAIFLLNRYDGNSLFRHIDCTYGSWFIYNNEFFCKEDDPFFLVFDFNSDGNDESVTRVGKTQDGMLSDMYSTSNYKYIWSKRFDAYNLTIKIDLY